MTATVSRTLKQAVLIATISTISRVRSSIPGGALHPMQRSLGVPGQTAAAVYGTLDPQPSHVPQNCWGYAKKSIKSFKEHVMPGEIEEEM